MRRAQDRAFELALVANIDGIDRFAGHLLPRFDARRAFGVAVVLAAAGVGDGAIDVVVGPAAAEMARKRAGDLLAGRGRGAARGPPGVVEGRRLDDEARGAEPALQRVERHEGALNGMQFDGADALDRGHAPARGGFRRQEAARDRNAVEQDRAGAADAGAADELGPGQAQCVAQDIDQERLGIVRKRRGAAVDEGGGHGFLLEGRRCDRFGRRGERSGDHQAKGTVEIGERARVGPLEIEPMRGELDRAGEPGRRHALPQDDLARGAGALDRAGDQAQFPVEEALMKIARLALLLGEQLLDLGRAFDQFEEIAKARLELRGENVGEPLAGLFLLQARGSLSLECAFVNGLDDSAEQRFLGGEMMIERLPGEAGLLRDQLHRGEAITVLAEHFRCGIDDAFTGRHLTSLTSYRRNVKSLRRPFRDALAHRRGMTPIDESANTRSGHNGR